MRRISAPVVLLCIFTVSGFSGLIYESIWSNYLKLFLGHAAYSQVLVLVIFMGGLAIGSVVAARFSVRWKQVLLGYAIVEAITGAIALLFHGAFDWITQASFAHVIPALGSAAAVQIYKWGLGAAMILPQSILLGMTFPLMTAAFLRFSPAKAGRSVSLLYFTNSIGGAIGVLASGFALIPNVGLPGTILTAGLLNFGVAFFAWLLIKSVPEVQAPAVEPEDSPGNCAAFAISYRLLLLASFVTGLASFCYEIGWIRMLSMVLGASTHAFEIMLSSFILGLALGGLWVSRRIDRSPDPRVLLANIQVAMSLLALSTLFIYGSTFDWMEQVINTFGRTDAGYVGFNWASHVLASAVMVPTTFCAGMTLPIITFTALRNGVGERAVGGVYAANTVGAIVGVALAVHVLMPLFNAKGVVVAGALFDFALGLLLFATMASPARSRSLARHSVVGLFAFSLAILSADVDPLKITSGVFRTGINRSTQDEVLYLRDGKTAKVSVMRKNQTIALATNGKIDATINMGSGTPTGDEVTQILLGALPLMLHPSPKTAAVIGFGSGMSTHVLLADPGLERVDTIEIEARMVEAAHRGFFPLNRLAYEDPRSHIHFEDAKTYFSVANRKYDIIVSEPSNPWVSGVSSLFTAEFYRHVARYLNDGGMLVQWIQLYEIDYASVTSVMKALSPAFDDYAVYIADPFDILVVATRNAGLGAPNGRIFAHPELQQRLAHIYVNSADDVRTRRLGGKALLDPFFATSLAPVNSDYFPFMDNRAARARFLALTAPEPMQILTTELPINEMLTIASPEPAWTALTSRNPFGRSKGQLIVRSVIEGIDDDALAQAREPVALARLGAQDCGAQAPKLWQSSWINVGRFVARYLDRDKAPVFWGKIVPPRCRERLGTDAQLWYRLLYAVGSRDSSAMVDHAAALLGRATPDSPESGTLYVAAALMLGHLARQEPEQAREVFEELPKRLPPGSQPSLEIRWLEAITVSKLQHN
jgi:spermidine synthase